MSEENVEIVRRAFDAFSRGDKTAWFELCDPQIEAIPIGDWPEAEIRGSEAVWDFLVAADEPWEPGAYDLTEIVDNDNYVAARMRRDLRGKSSGVEVKYDYWIVFSFHHGRGTRVEWFADRAEALEAAGLSE
jgi:ketosteroid isomerase-like protein